MCRNLLNATDKRMNSCFIFTDQRLQCHMTIQCVVHTQYAHDLIVFLDGNKDGVKRSALQITRHACHGTRILVGEHFEIFVIVMQLISDLHANLQTFCFGKIQNFLMIINGYGYVITEHLANKRHSIYQRFKSIQCASFLPDTKSGIFRPTIYIGNGFCFLNECSNISSTGET
ncbi:hypothetical protein D3C74_308240 [compost metagenome]